MDVRSFELFWGVVDRSLTVQIGTKRKLAMQGVADRWSGPAQALKVVQGSEQWIDLIHDRIVGS